MYKYIFKNNFFVLIRYDYNYVYLLHNIFASLLIQNIESLYFNRN